MSKPQSTSPYSAAVPDEQLYHKQLQVFRASAGTGKTFTLAARYIALLLDGQDFRSILAVTFTQKATAEMKQRIITNLYEIASGKLEDEDPFIVTISHFMRSNMATQPVFEWQPRAQTILRDILSDSDHFAVTTIDSYLQVLLAGLARKLQLRASYQVELDQDKVTQEAVNQLIQDNADFTTPTGKRLKTYIQDQMSDEKSYDIRKSLRKIGRQLFHEEYRKHEEQIKEDQGKKNSEYRKALLQLAKEAADGIRPKAQNFLDKYLQIPDNPRGKKINNYLWKYLTELLKALDCKAPYNSLPKFNATLTGLLAPNAHTGTDQQDEWVKQWHKSKEVDPGQAEAAYDDALELYRLGTQLVETSNSVTLTLQHLNDVSLLYTLDRYIQDIVHQQNKTLLSMTPHTLNRELKEDDAQFILEQTGVRYHSLMMDEFQDTSTSQWEIFSKIADEILASGAVLLVGDVKQSIYRWRNGDWRILQQIDQEGALQRHFQDQTAALIPLRRNQRSRQQIVEFNLALFDYLRQDPAMPFPRAALQQIYDEGFTTTDHSDYYRPDKKGGFVSVKLYVGKKTESLTKDIMQDTFDKILQLVDGGIPQEDIMILVRYNNEAAQIVEYLAQLQQGTNDTTPQQSDISRYRQLQMTSSEAFLLKASISVQLIINALRWLNDPSDDIALYYLIYHYHNDILGKPTDWEDIHRTISGKHLEDYLPQGLDKQLLDLPLYETVSRLTSILLYDDQGRRPLHDDGYVCCLMDCIISFANNYDSTIPNLLDYWDDRLSTTSVSGGETKGIRILTIHKAKGLESEIVFVPFCDWGNRENEIWCHPNQAPYDERNWLPITTGDKMELSIYHNDYVEERFLAEVDNVNLLYVALTRAKSSLYISGTKPQKPKENKSPSIWIYNYLSAQHVGGLTEDKTIYQYQTGAEKLQQPSTAVRGHNGHRLKPTITAIPVDIRSHTSRFLFRQSTEARDYLCPEEAQDQVATRRGLLLHALYAEIDVKAHAEAVIERFWVEGAFASLAERQEMARIIHQGWNNPQAARWFDGQWQLIRENNIIVYQGNGKVRPVRPDRVITNGQETIVIDFKSGKRRRQHQDQVKQYMQLLSHMGYPDVKGYLWYVSEKGAPIVGDK